MTDNPKPYGLLRKVCESLGFPYSKEGVVELDAYLGLGDVINWYRNETRYNLAFSPENVRLLESLTGPHSKTLAKAARIRRGLEC